jgi:putative thioredoxin
LDVDVEKALAAKLSVQSLPTVFGVHSGRLVDSFIGMRTDAEVQAFVDKLLKASEDMGPPSSAEGGATEEEEEPPKSPMEQAADALASGDVEAATALYKQVYSALRATTSSANPEANTQSRQDKDKGLLQQATCLVGLASCAQMSGDTDAVVELLSLVKKEHAFEVGNDAGLARAVAQLELATKGKASSSAEEGGSGSLADLEAKLSAALELEEGASSAEGVLALRLDLAHALFAQSRYDEALDQALLIVKADVQWREGAGKALCLQFFDALGNDHPAVKKGRRRLGNLLFV